MSAAALLAELTRMKVLFQARAVATVMDFPAPDANPFQQQATNNAPNLLPPLHVGTFRQPIPARGCEAHPALNSVNTGSDVLGHIAVKGGKGGFNHIEATNP